MTTARRDERGSLTVELVVLTPVLLIMALAMLGFGRVAETRQEVVGAARAGRRRHRPHQTPPAPRWRPGPQQSRGVGASPAPVSPLW